jgi:HK97 family phage major capsid protein
MPSALEGLLQRLKTSRDEYTAQRQAIVTDAEARGDQDLSVDETAEFRALTGVIEGLDERIEHTEGEVTRSGRHDPAVQRVRQTTSSTGGGGADAASATRSWATGTADALKRDLGGPEGRAVISGSVDVPSLVFPQVVSIPHPARLIDLFVNRQVAESMAFEYFKQSARVNRAAPVPDLATKPTSTLTVTPVNDRCRVIAHLSEPVPYRVWQDDHAIMSWLGDEMAAGVLDALEAEAISGTGTGEHMTGVLGLEALSTPSDRTHVAYTTDLPTTLRSAVTTLQNLGEQPTGWALSPSDAQTIDLLRWGTAGGLLTEGFDTGVSPGSDPSSNNIFGANIPRVVSPSIPAGTALLADWRQLKLFIREQMIVLVNAFGDSLFQANAVQLRGEMRVGVGVLRPRAFAIVDLTP